MVRIRLHIFVDCKWCRAARCGHRALQEFPVAGVGVLDDPAERDKLIANPGQIRTAPRVGADDPGGPCRTRPKYQWHFGEFAGIGHLP